MKIKAAQQAIEAILAAIPNSELPKFDRIEKDDRGDTIAWVGGHGLHLGSAKRNGVRDPRVYRERATRSAIEGEMAYRADVKHLKREES